MKIPFTICGLRFTIWKKSEAVAAPNRQPSIVNRKSQSGIALIITLILLAVTLVMAVAFLALSKRERGSVATQTDMDTAQLAARSALANAEAELIANDLSATNPFGFSLLVSTNFINYDGFDPGVASPTNVNYDYEIGGTPLTAGDFLQNLANLYYAPRAPVFIPQNGTNDFRFYLDLNRNGRFDTNGLVGEFDENGNYLGTGVEVGDPEWIGVLENPDVPYGPDNEFLARYAFIAVPAGNGLDLNYIHNQALIPEKNYSMNPMNVGYTSDAYFRNQGVGSWELNLAAFLADLNTNEWDPPTLDNPANDPYEYRQAENPPFANTGVAFEDAFDLLTNRYAGNYNTLASVQNLFGANGATAFEYDGIDGYSDGPLQTTIDTNEDFLVQDPVTLPWAGADSTNHYFDLMSDLFNTNETANFGIHLQNAGTNEWGGNTVSTYDSYTFYRLLEQLGTDSDPEENKINLNYSNAAAYFDAGVVTNITIYPGAETNFVPWQPVQFFTIAANQMLHDYSSNWFMTNPSNYLATYYGITNYPYTNSDGAGLYEFLQANNENFLGITGDGVPSFGITNIPVLIGNQFVYAPAVNRILQLAANIYDAAYFTNQYVPAAGGAPVAYLPSVFKPVFSVDNNNNVFISGFTEVTDTNFLANPILNLNYGPSIVSTLKANPNDLVFGVPLIIGAKKGFPNFNEFGMQTAFQLERKLQVTRTSTNETIAPDSSYTINQMFILSLSNQLAVECWNSYAATYARPINIYANDYLTLTLTNDESPYPLTTNYEIVSGSLQIPANGWPGFNLISPAASFQIPLNTNLIPVPDSIYRFNGGNPYLTTNTAVSYESNVVINGSIYPQPHWGLEITNNLQVYMVDANSGRIVDYVQLSGPTSDLDLSADIQQQWDTGNEGYNDLWDTGLDANYQNMPYGLVNQLGVSLGLYGLGSGPTGWGSQDQTTEENAIDGFRAFYHYSLLYNNTGNGLIGIDVSTNQTQTGYNPVATIFQNTSWQANDPLVHYIASDLNNPTGNGIFTVSQWPGNIGYVNQRYMPWGGNPVATGSDRQPFNLSFKDPLVINSDAWDFPTNKFPTVGWLGRVHRGTPWQTVYLKSSDVLNPANGGILTWTNWTGDNNNFDATNTSPTWDRLLFDVFTTAPNDNATRGQLSVNVGIGGHDLAAWSALLSGIVVPPPSITNTYSVIQPAGAYNPAFPPPLVEIVTNINDIRSQTVNVDGTAGVFEHVGDILRAPTLTVQSPFLNLANTNYNSDAMYEWLPQQIMSLLTVNDSPRYVIYCYGQTLKPAPGSIVTSAGSYFGMVTNYQVVAETAVRAVVRVEDANTPHPHIVVESYNVLPPY
ncbi:MAG TPA: hypothetical protein VMD27_03980 [Candidatus Aquilonibacter sp.]|nr:hypothetical protein [Candidatus Aquilonibacter sp.]